MSKLIIGIIIIVGIVFLIAMQQRGWEGIKSRPLDSGIQATQTIAEKTKDTYDYGRGIYDKFKNNETNNNSLTEVGQIPCSNDDDCNTLLDACENSCICQNDICWRQK